MATTQNGKITGFLNLRAVGGTQSGWIFPVAAGAFVKPVVTGGRHQHQGHSIAVFRREDAVIHHHLPLFGEGKQIRLEAHPLGVVARVKHHLSACVVRVGMCGCTACQPQHFAVRQDFRMERAFQPRFESHLARLIGC
jgi:hypothetical protein